jgi:hypothetical protein
VKLDKSGPSITLTVPGVNAAGWVNTLPVAVTAACADSPSGIKSCVGATLTTEGPNQVVTGTAIDIADNATNASTSANVDITKPTLSGAPTTSANNAGWYRNDVTIHWACADSLSGIAGSCTADGTIGSEGTGLTLSASAADKAGNATSATSSPTVKIDRTAPNTTATAPGSWNNTDVTVALNASDNLSGVKATHFVLDGGGQQDGATVQITSEGVHNLEFWSEDNAGNVEGHKNVQVKIDKTPPTITHTQTPQANATGWNNSDVTVSFTCTDTGSGINVDGCTSAVVATTEGQNQLVVGTAQDNAGNTATDPAVVSIDKTPPSVVANRDPAANADGWNNSDVTVGFQCADALSGIGIDGCSSPVVLGEGDNQAVTGTATDAAGNATSTTVGPVRVDKTDPLLWGTPSTTGWTNADVIVTWTCSDALSGISGSCPAPTTVSGEGNDLSASEEVRDRAGNTTRVTVSGIKIDRHAPSTSASVPRPLDSGWYAGQVLVTLTGVDPLSGVSKTYYSLDGGPAQEYSGPFSVTDKGTHTITFWSVDNAGNVEESSTPAHSIILKIDGVPPTITGSRTPASNTYGWNNTPVNVAFDCRDAESGIAGCAGDTTIGNEGSGQSATGTAIDNAGNDSTATVNDINIDLTKPTLTGTPTSDANGAGWYNGDVTIRWDAADGLSGIDPATLPPNSTVTGEGSSLGAGPVFVSDKAGNSATASVNGIKIDRVGPTITPVVPSPNAAGWYSGNVTVGFDCTDPALADGTPGSGVAACPSDRLASSNGADQSVTSDQASDRAGNTTAGKTVGGLKIDGLAPQSSADNQCISKNGWCKGQTSTVVITATDQAGLSGVKEIHYIVNGGSERTSSGATVEVIVPLNGSGIGNVKYWAVDRADNVEPVNGIALKYDNIAPTVTHKLNPTPNADEWNKNDVAVHFDAKDDDLGSGVDPATVTPDQTISTETAGQVVNGSADDLAGNHGTDSVTVRLDKTPPAVSGAATTSPNANGWYRGQVTVHFTCADPLSGVAVCPDDVTLTANGINQSVTRSATDKAGNSASATVSGINIDAEPPTITINGPVAGGVYTLGSVPTPSCTPTDNLSGAPSCSGTLTGGTANGVGTFTYMALATDKAGNTAITSVIYSVIYRWDGFLQPINDTAHNIAQDVSIFKAGSTVPAKFQLKKVDGTVVAANSVPAWLTPTKGSLTTASVDESLYADPATTGTAYRWDSTAQQYIYNWGTAKNQASYYWRVGVKLDDGRTYTVNIGLR